jgi:hypothetical protein
MNWNAQIGRDLRALDGIVAILLSLAGLAERAAVAPYPVRCAVFWFIRQAEAISTELVVGSACDTARAKWLVARMTVGRRLDLGEADLASSLGSLACAVAALTTQLRRLAFLHGRQPSGGRLDSGPRHGVPGQVRQVECPDTS